MTFWEKCTWVMAITIFGTYAVYVAIVLGRAANTSLTEVSYILPLVWTVGAAVAASFVGFIGVWVTSPKDHDMEDQRDKEIDRLGEYTGQWFIHTGALAALGMAMLEIDHFWIANALFLATVVSALAASARKIFAYRRGF